MNRKTLIAVICVLGHLLAGQVLAQEKKVICFVGHKTSHGFGAHEYNAGNHLIGEWLEQAYPGQIEARYSVNWPQDEETFFKDAATVVIFCSGGGGHLVNNHVPEFDKVMRTGAGLACLHYAVEVPLGPSAKGMLDWMGGYFEANWSVNPHWKAKFEVFPGHEAANGVKPFEIDDEWYFHMRFRGKMEGIVPILSAVAPEETMEREDGEHSGNPAVRKAVAAKEPQHVAWTYQRGDDYKKGRGFGFTGLHYHWNWEEDSFRKAVLNGVAWSANLPIPENGIETKKPTKEELEDNAMEFGGAQGRKPKKKVEKNANAKALFESKVIDPSTPGHAVDIDVAIPEGSKELFLVVDDDGGFACDWADWCEPRLIMADGAEKKLTDLQWKDAEVGWGQANVGKNAGGGELKVASKSVEYGIGVHANALIAYDLPPGVKRFKARGGLDNGGSDQNGGSSVKFAVYNVNPVDYVKKKNENRAGGGASHDPGDALGSLTVHAELEAQLFASEPMLLSPSAIDVDHRGRVWVCEVVNYRGHKGERPEGDRILILEDTDGDAKADKSIVFYQGQDVDSAHGICVLGDRVIISAGDDVFSLYDRDGDGKADEGSKELMFTKIGGTQHDHGIHAFHFGPDGRLYFNFGNAGQQLCDAKGNIVIDKAGNEVRGGNLPYQEGMVFRCELDGSNVETLGWNFRNNWEVSIDSYGTVWQSDNDDDGNKGVRINYVMEYGNYGYKDAITRAGWQDMRPGIEEEIPLRHWHLNDPGVVPNLIQTGAGSPTGICVYEGDLLPEVFRGQPIHCDAGPNVVRAYVTKPDGAGYSAEMLNILEGTEDRWFRPSDVVVAPDGSLIVADWYDPGVGGHGMGDLERGRIFRVTTSAALKYGAADLNLDSVDGLKSPNEEARYLTFQNLLKKGKTAEPELAKLFADKSATSQLRARALWLLARVNADAVIAACSDGDVNIRITALRAIRQLYPDKVLKSAEDMAGDSDARVRREVALALRFLDDPKASEIWVKLASQLKAGDRWGLEALGIGADLHWDARLAAMKNPSDEIIWRSRGTESAAKIAAILVAHPEKGVRFFRALHFQKDEGAKNAAYEAIFMEGSPEMALMAAGFLGSGKTGELSGGKERLDALLGPIRGTAAFVEMAEKFNLRGFGNDLVSYVISNPDAAEAVTAARLLLNDRGPMVKILRGSDQAKVSAVANALGKTGDRGAAGLLSQELKRKEASLVTKRALVNALIISGQGGSELLNLAKNGELEEALKPIAALGLARSPDQRLREEAANILPVPEALGAEKLPPMKELFSMSGNAKSGEASFSKAGCVTCHKVNGQFIDFGPDLTGIGNKLSKEGLFQAILYPSAAISHGFHGVILKKQNGESMAGYITGETDEEVTLRLPGGVSLAFPVKDISAREEMEQSLMPPGLAATLSAQELVDLIAYLQNLKG